MKRVTFKVATALKEAGYPQEWHECEYYYTENGELKRSGDYEGYSIEDITYNQRYAIPAPTYLEAWLWLWREKNIWIEVVIDKSTNKAYPIINDHTDWIFDSDENPEEAIIGAIEYIVNNNLIK